MDVKKNRPILCCHRIMRTHRHCKAGCILSLFSFCEVINGLGFGIELLRIFLRTLSTDESQREIHEDSRTPDICRTIKPIKPPKMLVKAETCEILVFFQKSFHSWLSNFVILAGVPMECQVTVAALTSRLGTTQDPKKNPSSVYFSKSFCGLVLHHNQAINSPIAMVVFQALLAPRGYRGSFS